MIKFNDILIDGIDKAIVNGVSGGISALGEPKAILVRFYGRMTVMPRKDLHDFRLRRYPGFNLYL